MRLLASLSSSFKTYPYLERIPYAVMLLCVGAWLWHTSEPITDIDRIVAVAIFLALFCGHRGRPFWFFWGIVVGAGLVASLPWLHSILVH